MIVPSAEILEETQESGWPVPEPTANLQLEELDSFGPFRAQKLGASSLTPDFILGYVFGLQVARTMIAGSAALALAHVDPNEVL